MKHIIIICLLFIIAACSPRQVQTPKEKILIQMLSRIEIAQGYARYCLEDNKKLNAYMYGNMQHIVASLAEQIAMHAPAGATDDEKFSYVQSKLGPYSKQIREKINQSFEQEGCSSKKSDSAKKLYVLFTTLHPVQINAIIEKELQKQN